MSAMLGGRRLRDDLLVVRKDEREEFEEPLEVMEEDESAQFLRAQRVIARSKRVVRAPRRPPGRREKPDDASEVDLMDVADSDSGDWGVGVEGLSPR
jgi:hypothetical protein